MDARKQPGSLSVHVHVPPAALTCVEGGGEGKGRGREGAGRGRNAMWNTLALDGSTLTLSAEREIRQLF